MSCAHAVIKSVFTCIRGRDYSTGTGLGRDYSMGREDVGTRTDVPCCYHVLVKYALCPYCNHVLCHSSDHVRVYLHAYRC